MMADAERHMEWRGPGLLSSLNATLLIAGFTESKIFVFIMKGFG